MLLLQAGNRLTEATAAGGGKQDNRLTGEVIGCEEAVDDGRRDVPPYGIQYVKEPAETVREFISAVAVTASPSLAADRAIPGYGRMCPAAR